jgi:hypothetical protein
MPLTKEIEDALPLIAQMPEEEQKEIARRLSIRAAAIDHARTLTTPELMKLMDLAMADLADRVNELKR